MFFINGKCTGEKQKYSVIRLWSICKSNFLSFLQVAIIPIYWSTEGREGEKAAVIGFAKELMSRLEDAGVTCRADTRDDLKPRQKMKYWYVWSLPA